MDKQALRIVFAGTPDFAASHLTAVISGGFNIVSAYSQPDRPSGRGKKLQPTPVKAVAQAHGIEVQQPLQFGDAEIHQLQDYAADVMVVVAYGLLLPKAILELPRYGCINVHASLLPRWRGAAPIERAIMAGDHQTGVSIMRMEEGLDTGAVLSTRQLAILDTDNSLTLTAKLCQAGCQSLCDSLQDLPSLLAHARQQDDAQAIYAKKIRKADAAIDFSLPAITLHNLIRAMYPRSPAWCLHQGKRLRLLESAVLPSDTQHPAGTIISCQHGSLDIACGEGLLRINKVQPEGKSAMDISSLLNGRADFFSNGMQLGTIS